MDDNGMVEMTPGVGAGVKRTWFTVMLGTVADTLAMIGILPK